MPDDGTDPREERHSEDGAKYVQPLPHGHPPGAVGFEVSG
jgi:hypothetical protein